MTDFYTLLALATASVSLIIGIISYYIGVKREERTYRYFAFMALCMTAFLFLPPAGFILTDQPPYEMNLLGKRIFIFVYYALFPWFITSYTGYKKVLVPGLISLWVVITYFIMFAALPDSSLPLWLFLAIIALVSTFVFGLASGINQLKKGDSTKAKWFIFAMVVFGLLLVLTITNIFFPQLGVFFPLHTSSIPFMFIMGIHIAMDYMKSNPGVQ
jgi:hypothetical protein